MRAVLRRSNGPRHPRLTVWDLEIDLASRVVTVGGEAVQLSAKEHDLLVALAEDPERVFKKEELLRKTLVLTDSECRLSGRSAEGGPCARRRLGPRGRSEGHDSPTDSVGAPARGRGH